MTETLLPQLRLDMHDTRARSIDPRDLFASPVREVWLEIGFGAGEHFAAQARIHPDVGFIGAEPYMSGVARLLSYVSDMRLENVRIVIDDAGILLRTLTDNSIAHADLLFPDPWPKRRHHKRRFVNPSNIDEMARVMRASAHWRMATDDMGYCRWMLARMTAHPAFCWTARRAADWRQRPDDTVATRYEHKALAQGRRPVYLDFRRRPRTNA